MRILLLGEYSNVHWTLAEGLRALGHEVKVVSNGDYWKNYPRDLSLVRKSSGKWDTTAYLLQTLWTFRKLKGYDIVQIINPVFLELKGDKMYPFYKYLRKYNKKIFMGAFGMDHYWVKTGLDCKTFRYSDFNIGDRIRKNKENDIFIEEWIHGEKGKLNKYIANDCDGIVAGLYEYDMCYRPVFPQKTKFIPFPVNLSSIKPKNSDNHLGINFFIGIQSSRDEYKGTDIMYRKLKEIKEKYPEACEIIKAENVPFPEYQKMMNNSDVLLDQLYSYTPGMNGLLAMAKGLVVVGGGEEENYEILEEDSLRPIVNVKPNEEDIFNKLETLILNKNLISKLSAESREYIQKHHDHVKVAQQYVDFWNSH